MTRRISAVGERMRRYVAAAMAVVVLPSMAPDTFGLACPHHVGHGDSHGAPGAWDVGGTPAGHVPSAPPVHGDPAHGHATPDPSTAVAIPATGDASHGADAPAPPCTCLGTCTVSGSATVASRAPTLPPLRITVRTADVPVPESRLATPVPFTLPLANAPPTQS